MAEILERTATSLAQEANAVSRTPKELRADLEECLTKIQSSGSFAVFEALDNPPNPGLCLKNGGPIGLPLSDHDASVILAASHAAPFGKGEQTIVDMSVRKTWELSPTDFEIRNKSWEQFVKSIVVKVSAGLGVDSAGRGVSAELYKMLLYDEGAMFKPHQDSEKAPRMFGTLVIALPSKHEGGEVRVTHAGKTKVFETSKFSEFNSSYLAWFSDVTHEVKPVLSGRRLVLTYNLIHTTLGSKQLAASSNKGMAKLRLLFSSWMGNIDNGMPTALAFLLEHQYTDASLRYDGMKGHDQQVASHLQEVCDETGFCFYLANLKREVEGGCDEDGGWGRGRSGYHEITEEVNRETTLTLVVEQDGTEIAQGLDFDEKHFVQESPFDNVDPDDEDYSGFTGNEGVSATHFYHRTVAVIMPKSHRMEFFFSQKSDEDRFYYSRSSESKKPQVATWIDRLSGELLQPSKSEAAQESLKQICEMVTSRMQTLISGPTPAHSFERQHPPFSDEDIFRVIKACADLDMKDLFLAAYEVCPERLTPFMFQSVGLALLRYDLELLLDKISKQLSSVHILSDRFEIIEEIRSGLGREAQESARDTIYQEWVKLQIDETLSSEAVTMASEKDGSALANLCERLPPQEIFVKVLPAVKRNVDNTPMAVAFLTQLFVAGIAGAIPEDVTNTIFRDIISDLADNFSLHSLGGSLAADKKIATGLAWGHFCRPQVEPEPVVDLQNSQNMATLLYQCQLLELTAELDQIVAKLTKEASTVNIELFNGVYLPFLKRIIALLPKDWEVGVPFKKLLSALLATYIIRVVKQEPTPPKDWARSRVGCSCGDCANLNAFLVNPREKIGRFAVNKKRRQHLHQRLESTGFKHETERTGSPQTLVVTKNQGQYEASHKAWKRRRDAAKEYLDGFEEETLKTYLGQAYEPIISLTVSKIMPFFSPAKPALTSNENASNRVLPPVTKRKVPAEVIVLSDSD